MRLRTQCRACGLPFPAEIARDTQELPCPQCGVARPVAAEGWSDDAPRRVEICPLCGCKHLYRQRDMHRAWGCALVALGAALVPWTYGLSLVALGLLDFWLHRRLRNAVVCYRCDTVYRDARPLPRQIEVAQGPAHHRRAGGEHAEVVEVVAVLDDVPRRGFP